MLRSICKNQKSKDKFAVHEAPNINNSDESSEEVIYSQGSSKVDDVYMDYNWDLDRFVEYNSPLKGKAILSPDNNSSHWNRKNNSSVMTNNHSPRRDETKNQIKR